MKLTLAEPKYLKESISVINGPGKCCDGNF